MQPNGVWKVPCSGTAFTRRPAILLTTSINAAPRRPIRSTGWYGEATWVLSGENRVYNAATASFSNPNRAFRSPLKGGGWGDVGSAGPLQRSRSQRQRGRVGQNIPTGGLRGGDQRS